MVDQCLWRGFEDFNSSVIFLPWRDFLWESPVWLEQGSCILSAQTHSAFLMNMQPHLQILMDFLFSIRVPGTACQPPKYCWPLLFQALKWKTASIIILLPKYENTLYSGWASETAPPPPLWPVCLPGIPPLDEEIDCALLDWLCSSPEEQETEPLWRPSRYAVFYSSIQRFDQFYFWQKWNFHWGKTAV